MLYRIARNWFVFVLVKNWKSLRYPKNIMHIKCPIDPNNLGSFKL